MATTSTTRTVKPTVQSTGSVTNRGVAIGVGRFRRPVTEADIVLAAWIRTGNRDAFTSLYRSTVERVTAFIAARVSP